MKIKGNISLIIAIFSCVLLASCEKNTGTNRFIGSYTYKISGKIGLVSSILSDTLFVSLNPEQGQMNIAKGNTPNQVIVTWDNLIGDISHTTATIDGNTITLDQGKKNIPIVTPLEADLAVTFNGKGNLYDNMLIIPMQYYSEYSIQGLTLKIVSSEVECVAKANN